MWVLVIRFDENFRLKLERKHNIIKVETNKSIYSNTQQSEKISCPKCNNGKILKGKSAYGCSDYKKGCNFVFTFENIKRIANGRTLSKELVLDIISK